MGSLSMDTVSMNHYEKQLYSVFKTFDVDDEEALNRSAVVQLCDALQLEDRGAALVDTLFERRTDRVTFTQFRNGLLTVLGGGDSSMVSTEHIGSVSSTNSTAVSLTTASSPVAVLSQSDEDSSGREAAPRIIFGSKKYGRRSRPQRTPSASDESPSPRAASVSRIDTDDRRIRNSQRMKYRRSTSAMDTRELLTSVDNETTVNNFDHNRRINYEQALSLCRELQMHSIDPRLIENIFEESQIKEDITVGEFFDRLNSLLSSSMEVAHNDTNITEHADVDEAIDDESSGISSGCIISCWEKAGMPHPRRFLMELGFTGARIRPPELERALEDELRACTEPLDEQHHARSLFLTAALELDRLRLRIAKRRIELTTAERDKLRGDVTEANRRASVLAQDNDEAHARMEAELAASIRRAEVRLAEVTRQAAEDRAAERERDAAARARLEAELSHRFDNETRLRKEVEAHLSRIAELEARAVASEARAAAAERSAARLAEEICAATAAAERVSCSAVSGAANERAEQLAELRAENQRLRDRNDELCCALDARARTGSATLPSIGIGDLSAELGDLLHHTEECDSSPASLEPRAMTYTEAARRLRELLRAGDSLASWQDKILEISNALMLMEQTNISIEASIQTDTASDEQTTQNDGHISLNVDHTALSDGQNASTDRQVASDGQTTSSDRQIALTDVQFAIHDTQSPTCDGQCHEAVQLRQKLVEAEATHGEEKQKLTDLIKELELSLEQLKEEYDRCEEYWSGKLEEERDALAEEQRLGDERLAELASKIGEYERQFAPNQSLPTIQEVGLEAQVTDLEEEFAAYRRAKEDELRERDQRIQRLVERLAELQAQDRVAGAGGGVGTCACAALAERCARLAAARGAASREAASLRARAASAEAAVRRLHARLAAADLLVKDLYVENCQLAHRRAL